MTDLPEGLLKEQDGAVLLQVKVVPGARKPKLAGLLGDRLKLAVSAPPEAGKANKAVCELVADWLGLPPRDVQVVTGMTQPRKTLLLQQVTCAKVKSEIEKL